MLGNLVGLSWQQPVPLEVLAPFLLVRLGILAVGLVSQTVHLEQRPFVGRLVLMLQLVLLPAAHQAAPVDLLTVLATLAFQLAILPVKPFVVQPILPSLFVPLLAVRQVDPVYLAFV